MVYRSMVLRRKHLDHPEVRVLRTSAVTIESNATVPVQIDGDPYGTAPVELRVLPGELELFVPESVS